MGNASGTRTVAPHIISWIPCVQACLLASFVYVQIRAQDVFLVVWGHRQGGSPAAARCAAFRTEGPVKPSACLSCLLSCYPAHGQALQTHEVCSRSPGGVFLLCSLCFSLVMLLFEMAHVHCAWRCLESSGRTALLMCLMEKLCVR